MDHGGALRVLTVGWDQALIEALFDRIAAKSSHSFSHLVHPMCDLETFKQRLRGDHIYWFFDTKNTKMPPADREYLASLERPDVPTIHNMILSDWVLSKLPYEEALAYAGFLAKRLATV